MPNQILENILIPSGIRGKKMLVSDQEDGQSAKLEIKKCHYNKKEDVSFVEILLKTGMRHQIRTQLSHLGHPIVGDSLYGEEKEEKEVRLFLHAYQYVLRIKDQKISFTAPQA